jgi:hypothetical protein
VTERQLRLAVVACLVAAVGLAVGGFILADGGGGDDLTVVDNPAIDAISPARSAEVLQQEVVSIDLAPGYEGTIARINDVDIPPRDVTFDPTRNIVTFDPGPGKILDALLPEQNCVTALYWRSAEGPSLAATFTWCFTAA